MLAPSPAPTFTLYYGSTPFATVAPDSLWPGTYRIHWPDRRVSDLGNLTRVRDTAIVMAQRSCPQWRLLRWKAEPAGQAAGSPLARLTRPGEG
jgi:hypothetical protein